MTTDLRECYHCPVGTPAHTLASHQVEGESEFTPAPEVMCTACPDSEPHTMRSHDLADDEESLRIRRDQRAKDMAAGGKPLCMNTIEPNYCETKCTDCPRYVEMPARNVPGVTLVDYGPTANPLPHLAQADMINHPPHYNTHPSGVECIEIVEWFGFNLGNAIKYIWRADEKGNAAEDLLKAEFYIKREIGRRTAQAAKDARDAA